VQATTFLSMNRWILWAYLWSAVLPSWPLLQMLHSPVRAREPVSQIHLARILAANFGRRAQYKSANRIAANPTGSLLAIEADGGILILSRPNHMVTSKY